LLIGTKLQGIEPLSVQSHNIEPYMSVIVVVAELSNSLGEGPAEVRHVEHTRAIGCLAPKVKRVASVPAVSPGASWPT